MAQKRSRGPYIWATTLAKLLTGDASCEWAGWFKAHHENWAKSPSDFDSSAWMLEHTALVNQERESRERLGYTVTTENQNLFRLRGSSATVAGKPDLIAERNHEVVIIDVKTGRVSPAHRAQVMIYQYAVPKVLEQFRGRRVSGHVRYPASHVAAPASAVNRAFVANPGALIRALIRRLADPRRRRAGCPALRNAGSATSRLPTVPPGSTSAMLPKETQRTSERTVAGTLTMRQERAPLNAGSPRTIIEKPSRQKHPGRAGYDDRRL